MKLVQKFNELNRNNSDIAGGKGASLGEMTQADIPVPPGFVILSDSFEQFIKEADLIQEIDAILDKVNHKEIHIIESASEQIRDLILSREMPKDIADEIQKYFKELNAEYIAVRSSATAEDGTEHAWAGQLESYLNTMEADLLDTVKRCWASLFTPRAIFYRFEKGFHATKISVAVVVQKMVNSELSGIAFSVHPITEDYNQLIIEAGYGLGEAIVSGQITPDSYVVEKDPRKILDVNVNNQKKGLYRKQGGGNEWRDIIDSQGKNQVLNEQQILELSEIILRIENHYGFPCDIEWAYEGGNFYIVQSRPITTLSRNGQGLKILLSKYMSREHSLFYAHVWNEANRDYFDEYIEGTNIRSMLFLLNKIGVLEVYYDLEELGHIFDTIAAEITKQPEILDNIIVDFYLYWEKLLPYVLNKKRIQTADELKDYYHNWMRWWSSMAYVFVIPDREQMPEELRNKALKVREETQEYSDDGDRIFINYIEDFYPQYRSIARLFTPEETYRLEVLSSTEIEQIKKREEGCVIVTLHGKSKLVPLVDLDSELRNGNALIEKVGHQSTDEIRGMAASSGVVKGKVKLVLTKSSLEEIQEGDVMVTYATSPDYVPAMKKCAAIVTDEGGVVCHAAIVSRELGIPCVVGTKNATDILKDDDEVEVDANNGLIKVLSPNIPTFEKIFARDFCMIALEIAALSEKREDKEWMSEPNPHKPYMLIERTDGTCNIWYNKKGIEWTNGTLLQRVKSDKGFLKNVEKEVREGISFIRPLYEKQEAVDRKDLIHFIDEFLRSYSWIEAMWWIKSMESEDVGSGHEDIVKLREETETLSAGTEIVIRKSLEKLYPNLGILSSMIRLEELRNDSIPSNDELQKRLNGFTIIDGELNLKSLNEVAAERNLILERNAVDHNAKELKGETAYKGKVIGKVCRVMGHTDFGKIQEGEILVSPMTMVDFLPEMKKAAAFITDEGGITCHAAIVAREMKKPCITGTQTASQILRDGDEVEVDADNGIVRIRAWLGRTQF